VLVTDVSREGRMVGADAERFARLAAATRHPLQAAGGIGGPADLAALERAGAAAAVLGMALYTGALDPGAILREFAT
jgi:phosphoribosylformimino-5-aminoimidazole carboxamide ribonucleotide (ProFAR) isomerase